MVCAWCESNIDGQPIELHRGPIPRDWRKVRATHGLADAISVMGETFATSLRVARGEERIEHYYFHAECWENLAQLLGGRP